MWPNQSGLGSRPLYAVFTSGRVAARTLDRRQLTKNYPAGSLFFKSSLSSTKIKDEIFLFFLVRNLKIEKTC